MSEMQRRGSSGAETTPRIRGTTPEIELAAKNLRRRLTPAEQTLWDALKERRLGGLKFRCQHPVGRFILDFYCPSLKLVVEVDGEVHEEQVEYDAARNEHLLAAGYRVVRFANRDVMANLPRVLERILVEAGGSARENHLSARRVRRTR